MISAMNGIKAEVREDDIPVPALDSHSWGVRKSLVFRTPLQTLGGAEHWLTFAPTYLPAASAGHFAEHCAAAMVVSASQF